MLEGLWAGGGKLEEAMHVHLSPSPMVNHLNKRYLPRPLTPTPSCLLISDDSSPFHHAPSFKSSLLHARAHTHAHAQILSAPLENRGPFLLGASIHQHPPHTRTHPSPRCVPLSSVQVMASPVDTSFCCLQPGTPPQGYWHLMIFLPTRLGGKGV